MVFDAQLADTPAGNPLAPETPSFEILVALDVVCVMVPIETPLQIVGLIEAAFATIFERTVTDKFLTALVPQEFCAETLMLPLADPVVKVTEFVPEPAVNTQPAGAVQL